MPEETDTKKAAKESKGFTAPIPDPGEGKLPEHIHPETLMAKGISPDTKQRVSVNLSALKAEFGDKAGLAKYTKIAKAGGFFDPNTEPTGSSFYPDLDIEGLPKDIRAKVDAILKEA